MPYTIDVQSTSRISDSIVHSVAAAANEAMTYESISDGAALTILLTDDEYLRQLNRQYLGVDRPTDVLSFPAGDPMPGSEELLEYLGDIAISVPTAEKQAAAKGHKPSAELQLLTIHGVLHLIGYDHLEPEGKAAMWDTQATILRKLGIESVQPTEDNHDD